MVNTSSHHSGRAHVRARARAVPLGFIVSRWFRCKCWCELYHLGKTIIDDIYEDRGMRVENNAFRDPERPSYPNWAVNIIGEFQVQVTGTAHTWRTFADVRPVPQRGLSRKLRNCLLRDDQRRRWGVPHHSVASRRKIAPLGRILWSRRRKRAAKITAKTAPAVSFTRAADRASGNVQKRVERAKKERVIVRLFRKNSRAARVSSSCCPLPIIRAFCGHFYIPFWLCSY